LILYYLLIPLLIIKLSIFIYKNPQLTNITIFIKIIFNNSIFKTKSIKSGKFIRINWNFDQKKLQIACTIWSYHPLACEVFKYLVRNTWCVLGIMPIFVTYVSSICILATVILCLFY